MTAIQIDDLLLSRPAQRRAAEVFESADRRQLGTWTDGVFRPAAGKGDHGRGLRRRRRVRAGRGPRRAADRDEARVTAARAADSGDLSINQSIDHPSISPEKCTARTPRGRCKRWPTKGARVCRSHGAGAPQVRQAAARRVARQDALRSVTGMFGTPDTGADPVQILAREIADASGTVRALRAALDELDADDAMHGPGRGVVDLHGERQVRLVRMCESAVKIGIESRSALVAEQLTSAMTSLVRRLIDGLDLDDEQRDRAHHNVTGGLRELPTPPTTGRN